MTLLWWSTLLLCVCASAEKTVLSREPGQSVTLECSSAGCLSDFTGYKGMYMYFYFREREEVLYYYPGPPEKITPRAKYNNRVQKEGSLMNHNITISNLTVDDSGVYSCIYKKKADSGVTCNIYILVVRVPSKVPSTLANEKCPPSVPSVWLVLIIVCISLLVTLLFISFIVPRVKQWTRRVRNVPQVSSDYVYEVMNKNGFRPPAAPEGSSPNPYEFESYRTSSH